MIKTYSELISFGSFKERFEYAKLSSFVGENTFGSSRYLNQDFYRSREWKSLRSKIILRDNGCDLAISDRPIYDRIVIHHLNPICIEDIENCSDLIFSPENLVCVSFATHNAVHYGDESNLVLDPAIRYPNDTCLWKSNI